MIELESFRDWVHNQLYEKACSKINKVKQEKAKSIMAEKSCKKNKKRYLVTEVDNVHYQVSRMDPQ